jgi:ribose 1,5-bisphosphokinase
MAQLFYIIGASGAGKDALMQYARRSLNGSRPLIFAHRYITRAPKEGNENHVYLSAEEFVVRRDGGLFALHWESHGLYYGIGREIDTWLENGFHVVINGSRGYLAVVRQLYPDMVTVVIEADPDLIRQRLEGRGRETPEQIEQRLQRKPVTPAMTADLITIQNNGPLHEGGDALIALLSSWA